MASSNDDFHESRSHPTNALQKALLRPSETPCPAYHTQTTANADNSCSVTKRSSTVIGSRISKHRSTAAGDHERETSNRNRIAGNAYKNKPSTNTTQGIITVHLNNRLCRRTAIQCFPQDTIRTLKIIASLQLGIRPEAMMLKRQGQRPLKDGLTLGDYEIGNGSSVDLEVHTGD